MGIDIILYGAGKKALSQIEVVRKLGYNPVLFCDSDKSKYGIKIEGLTVTRIEDAVKIFSNPYIWVTVENFNAKAEIWEFLLSMGFAKKQLVNYEDYEARYTCETLETLLCVSENKLTHCCYADEERSGLLPDLPGVYIDGNITSALTLFFANKKYIIDKLQDDDGSTICSGCKMLGQRYVRKRTPVIREISIGFSAPCQLSCCYCKARNAKNQIPYEQDLLVKNFDFHSLFSELRSRHLLSDLRRVVVGFGEISLFPNRDRIFSEISDFPLVILTNAVRFDEKIAGLSNIEYLNISLDSGTRETYKKVKGLNAFNSVLINIKKYIACGIKVIAKYIILPENSNDTDIKGFIQICVDSGISCVDISADVYRDDFNKNYVIETARKLIELCKEFELEYNVLSNLVGFRNSELILSNS